MSNATNNLDYLEEVKPEDVQGLFPQGDATHRSEDVKMRVAITINGVITEGELK